MTTTETRPSRVALVAHRLADPHPTGIGRYYREISTALAATDDPIQFELVSPRESRPASWVPAGLGPRSIRGNREALLLAWCLTRRPMADERLGTPDLVHLLHPWLPLPSRAPLVVTLHDLMPLLHPEWYGRKARWAGQRGLRAMADSAERILPVSQFVAEQAIAHLSVSPDRLEVVPEGISDRFFAAPSATDPTAARAAARHRVRPGRYLVAVGQVSTRKNLTPVLQALARLERLGDGSGEADLLLLGPDGVGAALVHRTIESLGLRSRVRPTGFVADDDLPALLAGALALVHPSLDEGFGFPPLEAMAAGTPAIVSSAGALPEVVGSAGVLVDPHDPDAWADAIEALLHDPARRASLVTAGRERAGRYSWRAAADRLTGVYRDVLDEAPR